MVKRDFGESLHVLPEEVLHRTNETNSTRKRENPILEPCSRIETQCSDQGWKRKTTLEKAEGVWRKVNDRVAEQVSLFILECQQLLFRNGCIVLHAELNNSFPT